MSISDINKIKDSAKFKPIKNPIMIDLTTRLKVEQ